ncbi:MAG TPA: hypothetical protein VGW38_03115, partial [Chloroflexota bacterium]|nr:hypothetical protein [Chloroflexota bacterium]
MSKALTLTPGTPSGLSWNGQPLEVWGVRVASAAVTDRWTDALIGQLDTYRQYGINALTVFYQGSSGGALPGFSPDGREIDPSVQARMVRIVQEAAARQMIVVAGIFYQAAEIQPGTDEPRWLQSRDAYLRATQEVARRLAPFENVIVNVANEHNSGRYETCPFPIREPDGIAELCVAVKQIDPHRLVGSGGIHPGRNEELAVRPELDILLFDNTAATYSQAAVEAYRATGSTKPMMNVEVFGASAAGYVELDESPLPLPGTGPLGYAHSPASPTRGEGEQSSPLLSWPGWKGHVRNEAPPGKRRLQGVFPQGEMEGKHRGKLDFLREIEYAANTPGFSLFGHFPGWYQGPSR